MHVKQNQDLGKGFKPAGQLLRNCREPRLSNRLPVASLWFWKITWAHSVTVFGEFTFCGTTVMNIHTYIYVIYIYIYVCVCVYICACTYICLLFFADIIIANLDGTEALQKHLWTFKGRPWKSSIIILQQNYYFSWLPFTAPRKNIAYHPIPPPKPNIDSAK